MFHSISLIWVMNWWQVDNKPLHEPMVSKIYATKISSLDHNEFIVLHPDLPMDLWFVLQMGRKSVPKDMPKYRHTWWIYCASTYMYTLVIWSNNCRMGTGGIINYSLCAISMTTRQYMAFVLHTSSYIHGLVRERRNSSALAMELHLSCTNPSILSWYINGLYWYKMAVTPVH